MAQVNRSQCPISFALDLFGDKWSLLILRDVILFGKTNYQDFLESGENISTNILADRLLKLEKNGFLLKRQDATNKKKFIYSPTKKGLDLLPAVFEIVLWGAHYDQHTGAPAKEIRKIKKDRDAYIARVRERFRR